MPRVWRVLRYQICSRGIIVAHSSVVVLYTFYTYVYSTADNNNGPAAVVQLHRTMPTTELEYEVDKGESKFLFLSTFPPRPPPPSARIVRSVCTIDARERNHVGYSKVVSTLDCSWSFRSRGPKISVCPNRRRFILYIIICVVNDYYYYYY